MGIFFVVGLIGFFVYMELGGGIFSNSGPPAAQLALNVSVIIGMVLAVLFIAWGNRKLYKAYVADIVSPLKYTILVILTYIVCVLLAFAIINL